MTYTTDNRLATFNGEMVGYDADGNMTSGPLNGTIANYFYDSRNRLTSAGSLFYQYDAQDHRISVQDPGNGSTTYIINPSTLSQVLVSIDPQGNETYYVYGLGLIGQENPDGSYQSYHYDLRGSTVALTDTLGQVTDTFEYGPYGELSTRTGTTQTPFLYNGRDGVMSDSYGLYYMRARYYNPEIKRFINQDILLGEIYSIQRLNRHAYCINNPIRYIDPTGYEQEPISTIVIRLQDEGIGVSVDWNGKARCANLKHGGQVISQFYIDKQPWLTIKDSHIMMEEQSVRQIIAVALRQGPSRPSEYQKVINSLNSVPGLFLESLQVLKPGDDYFIVLPSLDELQKMNDRNPYNNPLWPEYSPNKD